MSLIKSSTIDILDSIGEGLFTVNKDFKINFFNSAAERITGLKREEVFGKFCKHVFRSNRCFIKCPIAQVLETDKNIYELESKIRNRNGNFVPIKMNVSVLKNAENEPTGGVISFRDISELEIFREKHIKKNQFHGVVGHSKAMQEIFQLIEEISDSDASVLIQGDSGTGKEMIANAVQATSLRKDKPFIKVNCSVFSPQLLASELFGHVKGSFTGAIKDRQGRFEVADGGTLFLDEVCEMPMQTQLQLLRVIQEGTFERVGESITRTVDVRVIAASNKNIKETISQGNFREDLYYRLNVIPIEIPPIDERKEDIPHLVKHFIKKYALIYNKNIQDVEDDALEHLINYPWPGNVRELENAIEYSFARTKDKNIIEFCKLPPNIREKASPIVRQNKSCHSKDETTAIIQLLEKHQWNKTKVAKELGIGRSTLWRKLKELNLGE
ncbi:sigma 54-interacting transcriptional regulator [candidate division KSB1 bacterium]|nr:sigma 54-interacting transcriptional regulator [candidate division KSB1 bacterium]MBL7093709.1 sigma 54-interacting transcriptional regulator [candidate division KSB1 bacterium]